MEALVELPAVGCCDTHLTPRIVIFGDCLCDVVHGMVPFATALSNQLHKSGISAEVAACGFSGLSSLKLLQLAQEDELRDGRGRRGPGLRALLRGSQRPASAVIVIAGLCDLLQSGDEPIAVFRRLKTMLQLCLREGVRTVAMAVPDVGGDAEKTLFGSTLSARRRGTNSLLASWVRERDGEDRPELLVNPAALMPFGPGSVARGFWEKDGVHLTVAGASVFGERLGWVLRPLVATLRGSTRPLPTVSAANSSDGVTPSLDEFLLAFAMEDEEANFGAMEDIRHPPELAGLKEDAVLVIQRALRQLRLQGGRKQRLAVARVVVRQRDASLELNRLALASRKTALSRRVAVSSKFWDAG